MKPNSQSKGQVNTYYCTIINPDGQEAQWSYTIPPKPKVTGVQAKTSDNNLMLEIQGQQLSKDSTFKIGQDDVKTVQVTVTPSELDDQAAGLFKSLSVIIRNPQSGWKKQENMN